MLYCLLYFDVNAKLQIIFEVASIHAEIFDFFRLNLSLWEVRIFFGKTFGMRERLANFVGSNGKDYRYTWRARPL